MSISDKHDYKCIPDCVGEFLPTSMSLGQGYIFIARIFGPFPPPGSFISLDHSKKSSLCKEVFEWVLANVWTQECQLIVLRLGKGHAHKEIAEWKEIRKWPLTDSEDIKKIRKWDSEDMKNEQWWKINSVGTVSVIWRPKQVFAVSNIPKSLPVFPLVQVGQEFLLQPLRIDWYDHNL